eukprot:CAMPEP_0116550742 /NCGR_PEP_ID=MMETSP0397-20121206/5589_1 /TAXON_ID=216820 /ORGANISM="Cyclophora tenuis, Strain ECT3854" /LENGTH=111 /DNA_ID=CAMNT_0004075593 /DNA_START=279 /DNA_END=614 /DNA_ORIENTATION=+
MALRKSLGMPDHQVLVVYIATLPRCVESYLVGRTSVFFSSTTKRSRSGVEDFSFPGNLQFRVLLPHVEMKNEQPNIALYQQALNQVDTPPTRRSPRLACAGMEATDSTTDE